MKEKLMKFSDSYKAFRAKMIEKLKKPVSVCKTIFGYGIMISLLVGGLTFLGYLIAIIIGGDAAVEICKVIKTYITPAITYLSTIMVLFGLILMYLSGETALSASKKNKKGDKKEEKLEIKEEDQGEK